MEGEFPMLVVRAPDAGLREFVVEQILDVIRSSELKPGSRLPPEHVLASSFGVSRTVVREAVKTLQANGVISVEQGRGTFVAEFPLAQSFKVLSDMNRHRLSDLYDVRMILEGEFGLLRRVGAHQRAACRHEARAGPGRAARQGRELGGSARRRHRLPPDGDARHRAAAAPGDARSRRSALAAHEREFRRGDGPHEPLCEPATPSIPPCTRRSRPATASPPVVPCRSTFARRSSGASCTSGAAAAPPRRRRPSRRKAWRCPDRTARELI